MDFIPIDRLTPGNLSSLVENAKDWALTNGFVMRRSDSKERSDEGIIAPLSLLPSPFPSRLLKIGIDVQDDISLLYFRASNDFDFIASSLASVIKTDDFNKRLLDIYRTVKNEGFGQSRVLQIQRSDYMCHAPTDDPKTFSLKQVEVNNISSSFSALSFRCSNMHKIILRDLGYSVKEIKEKIPDNQAENTVVFGLVEGWKIYGNPEAVILVVVEDENQNIADQRLLEFSALERTNYGAKSIRLSLSNCYTHLKLDENTRKLTICDPADTANHHKGAVGSPNESANQKREVAVVYFRAGYAPDHYPTDKEWSARLMIERSTAIKCPWIGLHLSGTKKVQQVLAAPGMLEKYLHDRPAEAIALIRETFAGMWGLEAGQTATDEIVQKAMRTPKNFVLKPQLEGGGNNVYGEDIPQFLQKLSPQEREAFILMERILPQRHKGYLIRANAPVHLADTVSELGIYGYLLGETKTMTVISSSSDGHLLRTKTVGTDEGGIMAGASALDSPYLM